MPAALSLAGVASQAGAQQTEYEKAKNFCDTPEPLGFHGHFESENSVCKWPFVAFQELRSERTRSGLVVESHVRSNLIVVHAPSLNDALHFSQGSEPVDVQAFITQ
jgi:hypothetical protein